MSDWKNEILGIERLRAFVKEDVRTLIEDEEKEQQIVIRRLERHIVQIRNARGTHLSQKIEFLKKRHDRVSNSMRDKEILGAYNEGITVLEKLRKEILNIKP